MKKNQTLAEFKEALAKEGVTVVLRQSAQGNIYGITYVDFRTKCVFNGSDLGKEFSAKGILEQLKPEQNSEVSHQNQTQKNQLKQGNTNTPQNEHKQDHEQSDQHRSRVEMLRALGMLVKPEEPNNFIPDRLLKKKKQKKQTRGLRM